MSDETKAISCSSLRSTVVRSILRLGSSGKVVNLDSGGIDEIWQQLRPGAEALSKTSLYKEIHKNLMTISRSILIDQKYPLFDIWSLLPISEGVFVSDQGADDSYCFASKRILDAISHEKPVANWFNLTFDEKDDLFFPYFRKIGIKASVGPHVDPALLSLACSYSATGCEVFIQVAHDEKAPPELVLDFAGHFGGSLIIEPPLTLTDKNVAEWEDTLREYGKALIERPSFSGSVYPLSGSLNSVVCEHFNCSTLPDDELMSHFYRGARLKSVSLGITRQLVAESTGLERLLQESSITLEHLFQIAKHEYLNMMAHYLEGTSDHHIIEVWSRIFMLLDIRDENLINFVHDLILDQHNAGETYLSSLGSLLSKDGFHEIPADLKDKHRVMYSNSRNDFMKIQRLAQLLTKNTV